MEVEYIRDGKTFKTNATLKNFEGDTNIVKKVIPKTYEFEGLIFENLSTEQKERLGISGGALINTVGAPKWRIAGARPGFIVTSIIAENGRYKVTDAESIISTLSKLSGEQIVVLGMFNDGTEYYFEVELE